MSKRKDEKPQHYPDSSFREAVARLLQTGPSAMADVEKRIQERQGEVRKRVEEARKEIRRGVRPAGKKFRI